MTFSVFGVSGTGRAGATAASSSPRSPTGSPTGSRSADGGAIWAIALDGRDLGPPFEVRRDLMQRAAPAALVIMGDLVRSVSVFRTAA